MASSLHSTEIYGLPQGGSERLHIGIVVANWNGQVTEALVDGAVSTLRKEGLPGEHIPIIRVPGAVELTFGARELARCHLLEAIIVLGCVIQGETPHFDYVCRSVTQGITALNLQLAMPVIFGVITAGSLEQALDRAGGSSHKGVEAALTALHMAGIDYTSPSYPTK
ncbi:MAG: 6,7-dimethyl-8-ribityllumazine synthase [Tannerellaceae bacterium]|jgi:6,7-dimethyl-8-ribityllumazine synthase|nr:6,7-dimethyl-8-ribityllumazine synthase [Tannerellaceae bacterium]